MIIPDEQIQAIVFPTNVGGAFDNARLHYRTFQRITFEEDLLDYLRNGFVVSRPNLFAMAKVIVHPKDPRKAAWFIRYAWGEIREIYKVLPFYLPDIVWCRNDDGQLRLYKTDRVIAHAKNKTPRRSTEAAHGSNGSVAGSTPAVAVRKVEVMEAV